jgi:hypothetical protein
MICPIANRTPQTILGSTSRIRRNHLRKTVVGFSILVQVLAILIVATPCACLVCINPATTRSHLTVQALLQFKSPRQRLTLSCWLPTSRLRFSDNRTIRDHAKAGALRLSKNSEDKDNGRGSEGKLGGFIHRFRDWTRNLLRLSPDFAARVKQKSLATNILREEGANSETQEIAVAVPNIPKGPRWAVAADQTDLSGAWAPIVTQEFKKEYNDYLVKCGQSFFFRKVMVNGIALQKEHIKQKKQGRELEIFATNPVGNWNRTLVASGTNADSDHYEASNMTIQDPDGDMVQVEAWWEEEGKVHKSWLRGKPRLQGGGFETARYLEGRDILICKSTFHPSSTAPKSNDSAQNPTVVWRFRRAG